MAGDNPEAAPVTKVTSRNGQQSTQSGPVTVRDGNLVGEDSLACAIQNLTGSK